MTGMNKQQRLLLLQSLDKLSGDLKKAQDSERAELILQEMRNIGYQVKTLVRNHAPDQEFPHDENYKNYGGLHN